MGRMIRRILKLFIIIIAVLIVILIIFRIKYHNAIVGLARTHVMNITSDLINDAVDIQITIGNIQYERIVYFEKGLPGFIKALLNIANAISFWFAMDIFTDKMKMYNFYSRSFAVYAMHVNVSAIVCKLYYLILPKNQWFAFPNFVLTLVTTLVLINAFCLIVKKFLPKLSGVLMGER